MRFLLTNILFLLSFTAPNKRCETEEVSSTLKWGLSEQTVFKPEIVSGDRAPVELAWESFKEALFEPGILSVNRAPCVEDTYSSPARVCEKQRYPVKPTKVGVPLRAWYSLSVPPPRFSIPPSGVAYDACLKELSKPTFAKKVLPSFRSVSKQLASFQKKIETTHYLSRPRSM